MKPKILLALVALVALAGSSVPSSAGTPRAKTRVTIRVEGRDFSGTVRSPKPQRCANGRTIRLHKQQGAQQHPNTDQVVATDTASFNGERYEWSTGNTGQNGRFYARARRTAQCKADSSRTLQTE